MQKKLGTTGMAVPMMSAGVAPAGGAAAATAAAAPAAAEVRALPELSF